MKIRAVRNIIAMMGILFASAQLQAGPWVACGNLSQLSVANNGVLPNKPVAQYEYGMAYNSAEPVPIIVTFWDSGNGIRIYNKTPYFVDSNNPSEMKQGGFVFYSGTQANDDTCGNATFRHQYWRIEADNTIKTFWTNGCYGASGTGITNSGIGLYLNPVVYCRKR